MGDTIPNYTNADLEEHWWAEKIQQTLEQRCIAEDDPDIEAYIRCGETGWPY